MSDYVFPLKVDASFSPSKVGYYEADSGSDIKTPSGTPVVAFGDGQIVYSERGHTTWTTPPDTPNSILLKLDKPITINGTRYPMIWYTHLSSLVYQVPDGGSTKKVSKGEIIGKTGLGNRDEHLHFGIILNRAQNDGDFLPPGEVVRYLRALFLGGPDKEGEAIIKKFKCWYNKEKNKFTTMDWNGKMVDIDYFEGTFTSLGK
jgi:murein DD-endopeptidase MepM/ murein hydrolase activator NlpD